MIKWTYITNKDNSARYTLGKLGDKMLFFIGINPSTARPNDLDRTVTRVENFAFNNGYDGWLMLNVYPQRATNPKDMHLTKNADMHKEHIEQVKKFIQEQKNFDVCAAWGTEIDRRNYLKDCLKDLVEAIGYDTNWYCLHELTKFKHPRHPLYLPAKSKFSNFNIKEYLSHD
ncbi:hypothetical protein SAMN05428642_104183 [Flaviramulus basaltis]|uniref:DUF1643 domain-containing protein n=1 Tax=Flaviramulus basaltis TaxID=369401 RepID=A0A1K2IQA8_9FLAO|nr:DUF1643 domain-containing protein [Flaviramulus basaltis]SFZ94442.1 hypothetical protein SAMN05428642_104183 [Flaviramulus basaltis]